MSRENVGLIRRAHQAFNERDIDALLALFAEDVEWRLIGGFADLMGTEFRGRDAPRRFFNDWIENLGGQSELEAVVESEDRVVAVVRSVTAGGRSGAPARLRWGQVFTFRGGRISTIDNYYGASEALAAVGLSEQDAHADS